MFDPGVNIVTRNWKLVTLRDWSVKLQKHKLYIGTLRVGLCSAERFLGVKFESQSGVTKQRFRKVLFSSVVTHMGKSVFLESVLQKFHFQWSFSQDTWWRKPYPYRKSCFAWLRQFWVNFETTNEINPWLQLRITCLSPKGQSAWGNCIRAGCPRDKALSMPPQMSKQT